MKAIVPVAGAGTRLRPHTYSRPKPLIHVAGKPVIGHILDQLVPIGVKDVVLVVGDFGDQIVNYVSRTYDFNVRVVRQDEPLGLGHAVYLAKPMVDVDQPLLVVLGDTIFQADLESVLRAGQSSLGVARVDDPRAYGVVQIEKGKIVRLVEKPTNPPSDLAIVGVYFFARGKRLFSALDEVVSSGADHQGEIQLTDALQRMVDSGEEMGHFPVSEWLDCGTFENLLLTNRRLLEKRTSKSLEPITQGTSVLIPPVHVAPGARIVNSVVGPYVSVADAAVIEGSVVRNSIINEKTRISDILLTDSVIGAEAKLEGKFHRLNAGDSTEVRLW